MSSNYNIRLETPSDYREVENLVREGEDASFFLCKELVPGYFDGITSSYATPDSYMVSQELVDEFDQQFPPKKKLKLPGQLF